MSDINLIIQATDSASAVLNRINRNVDNLEKKAGKATGITKKLGAGLIAAGAAFAAFGVISKIQDTINDMDDLAKRARAVGATSEKSFLQFQIASQLLAEGGLSASETDRAFRNLNTRLAKGLEGNKAYAGVMDKLGGSILDANGKLKSTPELFSAVATAMQNGTINITDAQKILGEQVGPKILGVFQDLESKGISAADAMADVAANMSIVDLEDAQKAEQFNDSLGRLGEGFKQLMIDAIGPLLPVLIELSDTILANMPTIIDGVKNAFETMKPVLDLLSTVVTSILVPGLNLLFESLGYVAEAIAPLVDRLIPLITERMEKTKEIVKAVTDVIVPLAEAALPHLISAFETASTAVGKIRDIIAPLAKSTIPLLQTAFDKVKETIGTVIDAVGPLVDATLPALATGFEIAKTAISAVVDLITGIPEKFTAVLDSATALKDGVVNTFTGMKDKMTSLTESATSAVSDKFFEMYDYLVGNSVVPDMVDEIIAEMRTMATEMDAEAARGTAAVNTHMDKMSEKAITAARRTTLFKKAVTGVKKAQQDYGDSLNVNQQMLKKLPQLYADGEIGIAQYSSSLDQFGAAFAPMEVKAFRAMSSIKDGFHNMAGSVTDVFYNMFTGVTSAFDGLKQIAGMVFQMVAKALIQALIVRPLIGAITGGMGIPFFANGGFAKEGQPAIVGERGPELIVPSSNSRIVSNTNMRNMAAGGGSGVGGDTAHVTFNINAVSTRDGVEFLIQNKNTITGVVQEAFNRRGQGGPLG